ncbi:MAG: DUF89 family protein [Firmicutes bacterium]|nr:DUF89 family protein [Bacillota bacterium]
MKAKPECYICSLQQALSATRRVTNDPEKERKVINKSLEYLLGLDPEITPAEISSDLFRLICQELETHDPYREEMDYYNRQALELYPKLQQVMAKSKDRIYTGLLLAVAGNQIALGIIEEIDIEETIAQVLEEGLRLNDYEEFRKDLADAGSLLYLSDNAGEIVFDRILLEEIKKVYPDLPVTIAVKKEPAVNDALRVDALQTGIDRVGEIIDTGCGDLGVPKTRCSEEFWEAFRRADLVIAKGHANFETIEGEQEHPAVYALLRAKCPVVAGILGVEVFDSVFKKLS